LVSLPARRLRVRALAATCLVFVAGCGGGDEGTPAVSGSGPLGEGGTLVWAVADAVGTADPLQASTRAEQIATRQVNEPLTAKLNGPFETERRVPGLASRPRSSNDDTVWTFKLRQDVVFQDDAPFNVEAVLANARRWLSTVAGRSVLPTLVSVDSPSPGEVRFALSQPDRAFQKTLADPRLGIVSPRSFAPRSGEGAIVVGSAPAGTGPFEIRERRSDRTLLARNTAWWGAGVRTDLGPALDQIDLRVSASPSLRLAMLDAGDAQLADELGPTQAAQAKADPLLSVLPGAGDSFLGLERSVRGIESGREIPSLQAAWLTGVTIAD
jgi:ABC-type transport system substrate-binding protein